jgi:hypothetical protein
VVKHSAAQQNTAELSKQRIGMLAPAEAGGSLMKPREHQGLLCSVRVLAIVRVREIRTGVKGIRGGREGKERCTYFRGMDCGISLFLLVRHG